MLYLPYEIWRDVYWYEWIYIVSNMWSVISLRYKKINITKRMKPQVMKWYNIYTLSKDWKTKRIFWHRLVLNAFVCVNKDKSIITNHINWIRNDNNVNNLEWCTYKHNNKWKFVLWYKQNENVMKTLSLWRMKQIQNRKSTVVQMDWDVFIKKRDSIKEAQRLLWISNISACCRWVQKSAWWYKWKYFTL